MNILDLKKKDLSQNTSPLVLEGGSEINPSNGKYRKIIEIIQDLNDLSQPPKPKTGSKGSKF